MIQKDFLYEILQSQQNMLQKEKATLVRENIEQVQVIENFACIVSGIRRCGKSTLLKQIYSSKYPDALYVNFDDSRLYDFEIVDFQKIDSYIEQENKQVLMFDELQLIKGWERYVRQKLDEGFLVFVTGSNASLLSRELGTSLTGRHISTEMFPFSYKEFCRFFDMEQDTSSSELYLKMGGFPEYLKTENESILISLLDDILMRDIFVRYNIKDIRSLKRLTMFLLSNIGSLISANKLKEPSSLSSTTTILEYLSYLENSYLIFTVPMFDYSLKKQSINPKKIYAIDTGLIKVNVSSLKDDKGHRLENLVFISLRRKYKEIYYHKKKGECDFLVIEKGSINLALQVCYELNFENREREFAGLTEAMSIYNLSIGYIVTMNQEDSFIINNKEIKVLPYHKMDF
ncbi:MAG: ATP-binding protein [Bacteroidales bacterium]|nr:ATP-binding protein [Bacteroidales bacterium]